MSETYTVNQVAEILGYSTNSIYSFLKEGRIKGIRVGKGRFRITEEELKRVLHLSKKSQVEVESGQKTEMPGFSLKKTELPSNMHFDISSLFDWFVAVASILVGAALLLFSKNVGAADYALIQPWVPVIQVSLMAGGMGIILTDLLTNKISILWHKMFHLILLVTYIGLTFSGYQLNDAGSTILFGTISFVMVLNILRLLKGMESFLLFIILSSSLIPLGLLIAPDFFETPKTFEFMQNRPYFYYSLHFLIVILLGIVLWWSHYRKRLVFWICMGIYGMVFIVISFYLASSLMWSKSFFLMVAGLTCFLTPAWESLHLRDHQERRIILPIFTIVGALLLFIVGVIFVLEQNIKEYAQREFSNKVSYGEILVESNLTSIERLVSGLGDNQSLLEAIDKNEEEKAREILKTVFEGSQFVRRLYVLRGNGDLFSIYPYVELTESNFAFREYFKEVVRSKNFYLSDIFEPKTKAKFKAITLAGPIFDRNKNFRGVMVASIDLDRLFIRLQKIADEQRGEYFVVLNKNRRVIIHPNKSRIGSKLENLNILAKSAQESEGVGEGYNSEGIRMFQAFDKVDRAGWFVELQAPVYKILSPTKVVSMGLFFFVSVLVAVVGSYLLLVKIKIDIKAQ